MFVYKISVSVFGNCLKNKFLTALMSVCTKSNVCLLFLSDDCEVHLL